MTRSRKSISSLIPHNPRNESMMSASVRLEGEERAALAIRPITRSTAASRFTTPQSKTSWEMSEAREVNLEYKAKKRALKKAFIEVENKFVVDKKKKKKTMTAEAKEDKSVDTEVLPLQKPKSVYAYFTEMPEGLTPNEQHLFMAGLPSFTEDNIDDPKRGDTGKKAANLPNRFTLKMRRHPIKGHLIKYYERKSKEESKGGGQELI